MTGLVQKFTVIKISLNGTLVPVNFYEMREFKYGQKMKKTLHEQIHNYCSFFFYSQVWLLFLWFAELVALILYPWSIEHRKNNGKPLNFKHKSQCQRWCCFYFVSVFLCMIFIDWAHCQQNAGFCFIPFECDRAIGAIQCQVFWPANFEIQIFFCVLCIPLFYSSLLFICGGGGRRWVGIFVAIFSQRMLFSTRLFKNLKLCASSYCSYHIPSGGMSWQQK